MIRVLLAIDDYNELVFIQTLLQKVGFDVEAIKSTRMYLDTALGFNPQVVIASGVGRKVKGLELAKTARRRNGIPKFILLNPPGNTNRSLFDIPEVECVLDSPVNIKKMLSSLAEISGLELGSVMEKYERTQNRKSSEESGNLASPQAEKTVIQNTNKIIKGAENHDNFIMVKGGDGGESSGANPSAKGKEISRQPQSKENILGTNQGLPTSEHTKGLGSAGDGASELEPLSVTGPTEDIDVSHSIAGDKGEDPLTPPIQQVKSEGDRASANTLTVDEDIAGIIDVDEKPSTQSPLQSGESTDIDAQELASKNKPTSDIQSYDKMVSPVDHAAREKRFDQILETEKRPANIQFDHDRIKDFSRKIRATENVAEAEALDENRRAYVKRLFANQEGEED